MNLFPGRMHGGRFRGAGFDLPVTTVQEAVCGSIPILLGVRPEHIILDVHDGTPTRVEMVERWLPERRQLLHLKLGRDQCRMFTNDDTRFAHGDQIFLRFDPATYHLFDARTGRRLN